MNPTSVDMTGEILLGQAPLQFVFTRHTGALISVRGADSEGVALAAGEGNWRLVLAGESTVSREIGPGDMARFAIVRHTPDEAVFRWFDAGPGASTASVTVHWRVGGGFLSGTLFYDGFTLEIGVDKILFPLIAFPAKPESSLLVPVGLGVLIRNAPEALRNQERKLHWDYMVGGTMQCCAYLEAGNALYFDTRDPMGYIKDAGFELLDNDIFQYKAGHLIPRDDTSPLRYALPYPASFRPFCGGWFEAAALYREWAEAQPWAVASARRTALGLRKTIDDIALWVWNRGAADDAAVPVETLQKELGLPLALDWYWWHNQPYDTAYPRYFPPREGRDAFMKSVSRLKKHGVFVQVYTNGMLWDMDDPSWADGGQASASVNADGAVKNVRFNAFIPHRLAFICGSGREFRGKMIEVAAEVKALGLSGLYLDVIATACNAPCYNPVHDHPAGGGCYQVEGFRTLFQAIIDQCPDFPLSSESCSEPFMDLLDTSIMLEPSQERLGWWSYNTYGEVVPLFRAVYADACRLFGNYAIIDGIPPYDSLWPPEGKRETERDWQSLCPDQFFVEIARTVVWGLQPTVACLRREHLEEPKFRAEIEFLKHAARFYHAQRECLLWGRMTTPGELDTSAVKMSFLRRMIFTKEGEEVISEKCAPAVLHSVWQDRDGRQVLILANTSSVAQPCLWKREGREIAVTVAPRQFKAIEIMCAADNVESSPGRTAT